MRMREWQLSTEFVLCEPTAYVASRKEVQSSMLIQVGWCVAKHLRSYGKDAP